MLITPSNRMNAPTGNLHYLFTRPHQKWTHLAIQNLPHHLLLKLLLLLHLLLLLLLMVVASQIHTF